MMAVLRRDNRDRRRGAGTIVDLAILKQNGAKSKAQARAVVSSKRKRIARVEHDSFPIGSSRNIFVGGQLPVRKNVKRVNPEHCRGYRRAGAMRPSIDVKDDAISIFAERDAGALELQRSVSRFSHRHAAQMCALLSTQMASVYHREFSATLMHVAELKRWVHSRS